VNYFCVTSALILSNFAYLLLFSSPKRARVEEEKTNIDPRSLSMSSLTRPPPNTTPSLPRPAGSPSPKGMDIRKRLTMEYLIEQNKVLSRLLDRSDIISANLAKIANNLSSQSQSQVIKSQEIFHAQNRENQAKFEILLGKYNKACVDIDYLVSCVHPDLRDKVLSHLPSKKDAS